MILGIALLDLLMLLAFVFIGIWSSVNENIFGTIFTFVGLLVVAHFMIGVDLAAIHPVTYLASFAGYFLIGGVYTLLFSWPNYIRRRESVILNMKKNFETAKAEEHRWTTGLTDWKEQKEYKSRFTAAGQKTRLVTYICGWFWDAIWKLVKNPIKWAYDTVYRMFGNAYEKTATRVVDKIVGEDK